MQKVQKVENFNIQSDCKTMSKKRTRLIMCVYTQSKVTTRWRALVNRMIMKQRVKYEQIKKNLLCVFCKGDSIPRKQVQDCSKEFLGNNSTKKISWKSQRSQ